ncbi:hypothetical protein [Candidatus Paracaedibacter symbiosus]|uniref:hypothetical protein n=1 Tax=Candidatus Paracaedibacter symbiosus TaxID=244582 RepID=UPI000509C1BB|nr:hypothetical protein [Candidatus Paracaedibacter symbiosus]
MATLLQYNVAKVTKNGLKILVEVSANTTFDRPKKAIMIEQEKQDDQPIEVEKVENRVIQKEANKL